MFPPRGMEVQLHGRNNKYREMETETEIKRETKTVATATAETTVTTETETETTELNKTIPNCLRETTNT